MYKGFQLLHHVLGFGYLEVFENEGRKNFWFEFRAISKYK